jgi:ectoine hydroxylase-related dioxygenase (phytanoyl-CoA dioxygenase family)
MLVPGSHRVPFPTSGFAIERAPAGVVQLLSKAGDAVIFPWSLWHAVAPHRGDRARKSVALRYGQLWCRPYDYERLSPETLNRMTPRRRRLFGDLGLTAQPFNYYYLDEAEHLRLLEVEPE